MTIDFHTHVFPDKIAATVVAALKEKTREPLKAAGDGTVLQLTDQMDKAGIDRAVLCPIATKPEQFDSIIRFSTAIQERRMEIPKYQRLIPFASVHPDHPELFKQLEKIAQSGLKGIKLHPYYQNFDLDERRILDLLRCCRDLNLIILCHCGLDIGFPPAEICTPFKVLKIYERIEGIKFVAAHMGGWRMWKDVIKYLAGQPVYMDTAVLEADLETGEVQRILHSHPAEYLLLASDWPWCRLNRAADLIRDSKLDKKRKTRILGGNAVHLLQPGG